MFTEFGADAFNAKSGHEDAGAQAEIELAQWQELYQQSWGKGRAGNAIGGFVFQWTDGWWKVGQEKNLDVHDTIATWSNAAYAYDWSPGENNMNEEWFGLTALGMPDGRGLYHVRPRTAYYVLQQAFKLDPYSDETTPERIDAHFAAIHPAEYRGALSVERGAGAHQRARVAAHLQPAHPLRLLRQPRQRSHRARPRYGIRSYRVVLSRLRIAAVGEDLCAAVAQYRRQRRGESARSRSSTRIEIASWRWPARPPWRTERPPRSTGSATASGQRGTDARSRS